MNQEHNRCLECPARTQLGSCQLVDRAAGWVCGMKLATCDLCFTAGPDTGAGEAIRSAFLRDSVAGLKPRLTECKRPVIFAILTWHSSPEEREKLATPEVLDALDREVRWQTAASSFDEAEHFQRGTIKDFLKSLWSRAFEEPVPPETLAQRRGSCGLGGPAACPSLRKSADGVHHWCGDCGCGDKKRAWLDDAGKGGWTKLHYPYLVCPRGRPGFSNVRITVDGRSPVTR